MKGWNLLFCSLRNIVSTDNFDYFERIVKETTLFLYYPGIFLVIVQETPGKLQNILLGGRDLKPVIFEYAAVLVN